MLTLGYLLRALRYLRFAFDLIQYWGYIWLTPYVPASDAAKYNCSHDATIISPTLGAEPWYTHTVRSWLRANPKAIIIVTVDRAAEHIRQMLDFIEDDRIIIRAVRKPSMREQILEGIRNTSTDILVIADDRSPWSPRTLDCLVAAFADPLVGGVNVAQRVVPSTGPNWTMWESFGALNVVRRNILHSALAYFNDGQVLNLTGRLTAYRTCVLKNEEFFEAFTKEVWLGRYHITTGDDNALTRWTVQHGWKTSFQNSPDARVIARVRPDAVYFKQLRRWSRDTARSYLKDVAFAIRNGKRRDYIRCILNIAANYASDFAVLMELAFLLVYYAATASGLHPAQGSGTL